MLDYCDWSTGGQLLVPCRVVVALQLCFFTARGSRFSFGGPILEHRCLLLMLVEVVDLPAARFVIAVLLLKRGLLTCHMWLLNRQTQHCSLKLTDRPKHTAFARHNSLSDHYLAAARYFSLLLATKS
ncbi:hypothetical protein L195_g000783 [Trifolium pratense]|uniref:Uncharacterized protein n=1 Tax=Trifolium pratense TaxID=57577 RepID=A0A2K3NMU8_TRIPR|nr:hypothetical protein L195_g000783 [Trifolium pratense]